MTKRAYEEGANANAVRKLAGIIAVIIILAVAALGDVMYILEMQKVFSSGGILIVFCYLGAFTSFMAIGYLLLGKSVVFRPGGQIIAAWCVFAVELLIIGLNILLAFSPDRSGFLGAWALVSPATPVFHMLGVALIFFLDPVLRDKHHSMEIQEKMDKAERETEYEIFDAGINLKRKQTEHLSKALAAAVNSQTSLDAIQQFAHSYNASLLAEMTGMSLVGGPSAVPGLPSGNRTVEADKPVMQSASFAQTDSINVPLEPRQQGYGDFIIQAMKAGKLKFMSAQEVAQVTNEQVEEVQDKMKRHGLDEGADGEPMADKEPVKKKVGRPRKDQGESTQTK